MTHAHEQQLRAIGAHVLTAGFSESRWSDVTLLVNSVAGWHAQFHLHGIVLTRLPFFARRLPESRQLILELFIHDPTISQEALHICLAHIYGAAAPDQLASTTARALLSAASLLELDELADWALEQSKAHFTADEDVLSATRYVASAAATAAAASTASASSSAQAVQQQAGAHLLVNDHWALLQQHAGGAGVFGSAPAPHELGNGVSHAFRHPHQHPAPNDPSILAASPDISSASSPNTFDPTALAEPPRAHNGGPSGSWAHNHPPPGLHVHAHNGGSQNGNSTSHHYPLPFPATFPSRIATLQQALFSYLSSSLPAELGAFSKALPATSAASGSRTAGGADKLLDIYAQLDFDLFREIMQSSQLPVAGVQERFAFAKRCIAVRNKAHAAQLRAQQQQQQQSDAASGPSSAGAEPLAEEQVVLAFGGSIGGSGSSGTGMFFGGGGGGTGSSEGMVQIFRKPVRQRRYAKASAALS
ncbi:hypothetical protein OC834_004366 [Tilletia horrida]|nr:hypothetical protein OC834_004366 [Tilletia horrida]